MTGKAIKYDLDNDGIALLTIDVEGESMNVINQIFMSEMTGHLKTITDDENVKGAVICSGKDNAFMAGADLNMVLGDLAGRDDASAAEIFQASFSLSKLFREIETCGKPFAIAINGLCLGGGLELALALELELGLPLARCNCAWALSLHVA